MSTTVSRALVVVVVATIMVVFWWLVRPDPVQSEPGWTVVSVIDGDTIEVERGDVEERVRFIGIDTPEREQCGYDEARDFLVEIVLDQQVTLVPGAPTDRDAYGRLLRYVEYGGLDVGLGAISEGLAVARYDSRTGQPHDREELYREADAATPHICATA